MSDSAMAHSLFAQVQRIVELQQEVATVRERKDEASRTLRSLEQQARDLEQKFKSAKQLLNHCIDTGEDPIAVQLSVSDSTDLADFEEVDNNHFYQTLSHLKNMQYLLSNSVSPSIKRKKI